MEQRTPGAAIVLNGTSSAGKSSLLRALQDILPGGPWLDVGLDHTLRALPREFLTSRWKDVFEYTYADDGTVCAVRPGPVGNQLVDGMHRAAAAYQACGFNVILDHVALTMDWATGCRTVLISPVIVGVRCAVETVEQREAGRKDRTLGQARAQHAAVHTYLTYDLEVDTAIDTPTECAAYIRQRLAERSATRG